MQRIPEYSNSEVCERLVEMGTEPYLQEYFKKCIDFHTYAAPGILIGVFMVDFALDLIGKKPADKVFVTCESYKCLPDAPQIIMHATIGNHQLRVLPIGKFAITLTPFTAKDKAEGVRVYIDRKKLDKYPAYALWFDNSPEFKPAYMKRQLVDEILSAKRDAFSHECILMSVTHKKKWRSAICPTCGEQIPKDLMEGDICAGCGSLSYYEKC
jgi:formylmethanofuran dehydrogenase subunit E